VRAPVELLWGADDKEVPVEIAHRVASLLTGDVDVHVLAGVGHLVPTEAPEALVDAVSRVLT